MRLPGAARRNTVKDPITLPAGFTPPPEPGTAQANGPMGIDIKKLSYKGYGKQYLIANPGEAINQRVEIKILSLQ